MGTEIRPLQGKRKYKMKLLGNPHLANKAVFRGLCGKVFLWCLWAAVGNVKGEKLEDGGDSLPLHLAQLCSFYILDFQISLFK